MIERIKNERLYECCETFRQSCGLAILLIPKKSMMTHASLIVHFGSRDTLFEVNGEQVKCPDGVAHFLEHKLFARPDGTDANDLFSALGADANAWTDYDKTAYLFNTTENAGEALRTLVKFVSEPYFTRENVARERGIIREEIAMGEDDPWQRLFEQTMKAMYARHAVRRKICGTASSIQRITHRTLQRCYDAFYRPSNMYLVVCGNITMDEIIASVDEPLNDWSQRTKATPAGMRIYEADRPRLVRRKAWQEGAVARPIFQIGWKNTELPTDPQQRLRHETEMDILSEMLFCRAGRFYHELFESGKLSPSYSYGYSTLSGQHGIAHHVVAGEADDPEQVWKAYCNYLKEIRRTGLDREDFERLRRVLYASFVSEFDFPDGIADLLCEAHGDGHAIFDTLDVLQSVMFEDICALFERSFDLSMTVFSTIVPDITNNDKEDQ